MSKTSSGEPVSGAWPALDIHFPADHCTGSVDRLWALLDDFSPTAISDLTTTGWRVFFSTAATRDAARAAVLTQGFALHAAGVSVPDEDWARRSQAEVGPIQVGGVTVTPPWASGPSDQEGADLRLIIEPSTGFGTGHHASTRLCLLALQRLDLTGRLVLDLGTGSGILGAAASRLGAARVVAVDHDPMAIQAARDTIRRNELTNVRLVAGDLRAVNRATADIVVANLTWAIIARHAEALARHVRRPGWLIVAGFTQDQEEAVARALSGAWNRRSRLCEEEWVALVLERH